MSKFDYTFQSGLTQISHRQVEAKAFEQLPLWDPSPSWIAILEYCQEYFFPSNLRKTWLQHLRPKKHPKGSLIRNSHETAHLLMQVNDLYQANDTSPEVREMLCPLIPDIQNLITNQQYLEESRLSAAGQNAGS